jgi:hypothetical protein
MLPGGNDTLSSLKSGLGRVSKAQQAYKTASGLLGGQPQGGGMAPQSRPNFGAGASQPNFALMTTQPNSMMQPQGGMSGQQLTPQQIALLLKLQQGGMYG